MEKNLCTYVFQNETNTISPSEFEKRWIELINALEKEKVIRLPDNRDKLFSVQYPNRRKQLVSFRKRRRQ